MSAHVHRLHPGGFAPGYEDAVRIAEALLFGSTEPLASDEIAVRLPCPPDVGAVLSDLQRAYANRGVNLVQVAGRWAFRTAPDLSVALSPLKAEPRKLSRAALEILAIIAYHQPATRAEIEEIRGVSTAKGTLDALLELGWIRLRGRRKSPGRPVTFGTTPGFLDHFGLNAVTDLPGLDDLKALGLLEGRLPSGFGVPVPDDTSLREDEEPIEADLGSVGSGDLADD